MKRQSSQELAPDVAVAGVDRAGTASPALAGAATEPFDAFYRREFTHLLVLARALVGAAYAEDVAQESMLVAYRRWSTIGGLRSPAGYVRGICLHKAVSVVRRRKVEQQVLGRLAPSAPPTDGLPPDSERFWAEVRLLPRRQAQVVALHYALDLAVADVAEVLECAEGTVKVHLHRARATLSTRLRGEEEGR
ncbi:RNA polymerase sigma factor [Nocardioides taihuensis]|uniref:RNA polymerase sigma factor n=1 Tax=Nocardioides taihuensis TaxID=1835606 RepID=A0ABW0BF82_9ACTN